MLNLQVLLIAAIIATNTFLQHFYYFELFILLHLSVWYSDNFLFLLVALFYTT